MHRMNNVRGAKEEDLTWQREQETPGLKAGTSGKA